jgi:hypothetical protein
MRVNSKATTIAAAVAFIFTMTASTLFVTGHAESSVSVTSSTGDGSNSISVTRSTGDGLKVECKGNLKCEITGDGTVVATSEDHSTSTIATSTILNQSDIVQSEIGLDAIDEQDLGSRITELVNRLLDTTLLNIQKMLE